MIEPYKFILFHIILVVIGIKSVSAQDAILGPNPALAPIEVVRVQLDALKNKAQKDVRLGILKTWQFAHPRNKAITGPFNRFSKMIKETGYSILLNHLSNKIRILSKNQNHEVYRVEVVANNGRLFSMEWVVTIVKSGKLKNCWMTSAVSLPSLKGPAI